MLPDKTVLVGQKLVENDKIQKFKCDILSNFQTMCGCVKISLFHWFPRLNYFYLLHKKAAKPDIRDIMTCPISQIRDNVLGLWMPSSFQSLTSGSSDPVQMKWRLNFLDLVLYVRLIVITLWKKKSYLKPFGVSHSVWKSPKMSHLSFSILAFSCLVTLFDSKLQFFKNSLKWTIFGIFN